MLNFYVRGIVACVFLIATGAPLSAQSDTGQSITISMADALSRTLANNPTLKAQGLAVDAAEGHLLQSTYRPYPQLIVNVQDAFGTGDFSGMSGSETTISLGWMLERGVRERIVDVAQAGVDATHIDIEIAQLDAVAETARRFIEVLVFQDRYRNAELGVELAQDAVDAVSVRVAASRALEAELALAEAELARAELRLDDYEHELLSAYYRLSAQWGITRPDFERAAGSLSGPPAIDPFESLLARIEQNPDLAAFVSQSRVAEAEVNLTRAQARPSWQISGGLRRAELTDDWMLVGSVIVPLKFGNRNEGRIAEARATVDQIELTAEAARIFIETELFVLYQELTHNFELAEALEHEVAPRIERALEDTQRAFELGRSSYLEYRAVQTELLEVAYEILDAHADAWRLAIELERLTGAPLRAAPSER